MTTIAHGIDIVENRRLAALLARHPERARRRLFTPAELAYADGTKREIEHLAARFAAKEAVLKALGTGWAGGIAWTDIEVTRSDTGQPGVLLSGTAAGVAAQRGITSWLLSISHTETMSSASVVGISD